MQRMNVLANKPKQNKERSKLIFKFHENKQFNLRIRLLNLNSTFKGLRTNFVLWRLSRYQTIDKKWGYLSALLNAASFESWSTIKSSENLKAKRKSELKRIIKFETPTAYAPLGIIAYTSFYRVWNSLTLYFDVGWSF